jgi:hypothetical protein
MKQGLFLQAEDHYPSGGITFSARAFVVEATFFALAEKLQITPFCFFYAFL